VIATGPFQTPRMPAWSRELPSTVVQVHSSGYRNPEQLPPGAVLVVGSGASGQQIVEDLQRGGRTVYVCVGRSSRMPRRYRGHDILWWLEHGGYYEKTAVDVPSSQRYGGVSHSLTGYAGGHDLQLRQLHAAGATLLGRATGVRGGKLQLGTNLAESLAAGDRAYEEFVSWVEERLDRFEGAFTEPEPREQFPDPPEPPTELDLGANGISAIVWASGFEPDFARWVRLPVLGDDGHPVHERGVTACSGVYFLGQEWLHRSRSPFIRGADEDAHHIASVITG
jgi:putative flavoprotein involved in K+ transport